MKFGLQKCTTVMRKGERKMEDIEIRLPDGQMMEDLGDRSHKCLGALESDNIKMK